MVDGEEVIGGQGILVGGILVGVVVSSGRRRVWH